MKNHWVREFYNLSDSKGIKCKIERVVNGWIETINFAGKEFFTKSVTYNLSRKQFFQGVDPPKLNESGDFVLICGGVRNILSEIFIIPWGEFFGTLRNGKPINTYKPPREYFQYKFYLRDRNNRWLMSVQGGYRPILDVTNRHYNIAKALEFIAAIK